MCEKTASRRQPVFVDDTQGTKPDIALIAAVTERKSVTAIEPTDAGDTTSVLFFLMADVIGHNRYSYAFYRHFFKDEEIIR